MKHFVEFQREGVGQAEEWTTAKLLKLIRTSHGINMVIKKDGIKYHVEADFIKSII